MISTTITGRTAGTTLVAIFVAAPLVAGQTPAPDQPAPPAQQSEQSQFFFSPWTKFCLKGQEPDAKQVCFSRKEGRIERGDSYPGLQPIRKCSRNSSARFNRNWRAARRKPANGSAAFMSRARKRPTGNLLN